MFDYIIGELKKIQCIDRISFSVRKNIVYQVQFVNFTRIVLYLKHLWCKRTFQFYPSHFSEKVFLW